MIGVLKFKLPEEQEEFITAQKGGVYKAVISDIGNNVFRPARKHGYSDPEISALIEIIGQTQATELIGLLEQKFYQILEEWNANDE